MCVCSGALLPDALARAAHLAVQLDHLEDGLLPTAAQVVEQAVVLLREPMEHAEDEAWQEGEWLVYIHLSTHGHTYTYIHTFIFTPAFTYILGLGGYQFVPKTGL